jgi:hypothetical protein
LHVSVLNGLYDASVKSKESQEMHREVSVIVRVLLKVIDLNKVVLYLIDVYQWFLKCRGRIEED